MTLTPEQVIEMYPRTIAEAREGIATGKMTWYDHTTGQTVPNPTDEEIQIEIDRMARARHDLEESNKLIAWMDGYLAALRAMRSQP